MLPFWLSKGFAPLSKPYSNAIKPHNIKIRGVIMFHTRQTRIHQIQQIVGTIVSATFFALSVCSIFVLA
jgi:hypothetical protein